MAPPRSWKQSPPTDPSEAETAKLVANVGPPGELSAAALARIAAALRAEPLPWYQRLRLPLALGTVGACAAVAALVVQLPHAPRSGQLFARAELPKASSETAVLQPDPQAVRQPEADRSAPVSPTPGGGGSPSAAPAPPEAREKGALATGARNALAAPPEPDAFAAKAERAAAPDAVGSAAPADARPEPGISAPKAKRATAPERRGSLAAADGAAPASASAPAPAALAAPAAAAAKPSFAERARARPDADAALGGVASAPPPPLGVLPGDPSLEAALADAEAGNCPSKLGTLNRVLASSPQPQLAARAYFDRARCLLQLGDLLGARRALELCLESDPRGPRAPEARRLLVSTAP